MRRQYELAGSNRFRLVDIGDRRHRGRDKRAPLGGAKLEYDPTTVYRERKIHGWRVWVNDKLLAETNLCAPTLQLLDAQLAQITNVIPARPLAQLRQIRSGSSARASSFPACAITNRRRGCAPMG